MTEAAQGAFDFAPIVHPEPAGHETLQQRFDAFHELNPWVGRELARLTTDLLAHGRRRIGIKMLVEVLRWQYQRGTTDPASDFKLNNNYSSRYVRLLIDLHPEWANVFETRTLKA